MNTFGNILRLTTFGESHGPAIGGILDGFPAGVAIDFDHVQAEVDRRRPGAGLPGSTTRHEPDRVEILSGIFEGYSLGTPIGFIIRNNDARSADYDQLRHAYRPSHADFTYDARYGRRDHRGGGRASARETACRVVAGALAIQMLEQTGVHVMAWTSGVGPITGVQPAATGRVVTRHDVYRSPVRCANSDIAPQMQTLIEQARHKGDTLGGTVTCIISGVPAGLGSPVFGKLQASLAQAMMSIPAAKGFEYGMGFEGCTKRGKEVADGFGINSDGKVYVTSNWSGGIQGGISNGQPISFTVAFKPVATIPGEIATVTDRGDTTKITIGGRHDSCVVPRAVPVVEAMTALTVADALLEARCAKFREL